MTQRRDFLTTTVLGSAALMLAPGVARATQGVSKNEIVLGSLLDLSGPVVSLGKGMQNGMLMRTEEINAAGGVHGRKLRLMIEDTTYDPKKGILGAQKLLTRDNIFAMIGSIGTGVTLPTIPLCVERSVPHLFPITAHKGNFEPLNKYTFATFTPYQLMAGNGVAHLLRGGKYKRIAILIQDDEFGMDVLRGTETAMANAKMTLVEKTTFKRGATEFDAQIQKIRAANADLIVLATIARETIGAMAAGRRLGYEGDFVQISVVPAVAKAGGKAVEGLYAVGEIGNPYRDDPGNPKELNDWMDRYQARFKEEADLWPVYGWMFIDMFAKAAEKAGANLTSEGFVGALENMTYPSNFLGGPDYTWTPTSHLGNVKTRMHQIQNGRFKPLTDYF